METDNNEQLNIDCDCHAKCYIQSTHQPSMAFSNPQTPEAQLHISIDGKIICRKFLPALCHAASTPHYYTYLRKKLHWTSQDADDVHWIILQMALKLFLPNDQHCHVFFINNKFLLHTSNTHLHWVPSLPIISEGTRRQVTFP